MTESKLQNTTISTNASNSQERKDSPTEPLTPRKSPLARTISPNSASAAAAAIAAATTGFVTSHQTTSPPMATASEKFILPKSENINVNHLKHFATTLANEHRVSQKKTKPRLLERLEENVQVLRQAHEMLHEALLTRRRISSIDEWLLDNFYLIEEQIHMAKRHLPEGFAKEMPRLDNNSALHGMPRVYALALEFISLVDGLAQKDTLEQFIDTYQSISPLLIGELWAIPIMLRLGLIENIRRIADGIISRRKDCNIADYWADTLLQAAEKNSKDVVAILYTMSQKDISISNAFVIQLIKRLQGSNPLLSLVNTWLEQQLSTRGLDFDEIFRSQRHITHVDLVSLRNSIGSLRFVNTANWRDFVERHSRIEAILREDPAGIYFLQDFATRDRCRHAVEGIAKAKKQSEEKIAKLALQLAKEAYNAAHGLKFSSSSVSAVSSTTNMSRSGAPTPIVDDLQQQKKFFVGYYLLEKKGVYQLLKKANLPLPLSYQFEQRFNVDLNLALFLGSIFSISLLFTWIVFSRIASNMVTENDSGSLNIFFNLLILLIPTLIVGSQLAVSMTNDLSVFFSSPSHFPRMDYSSGIPDNHRTMVVVPTMLTSENGIKSLINDLQARFLVNRDKNLIFGLLTDFTDSKTEHAPNDEKLINFAVQQINRLNEMYKDQPSFSKTMFYLFHRSRKFNEQEGAWMGWERKRGKLTDFNRFLRGGPEDPFSHIIGDKSVLKTIQYIITLDTDTQLPPETARKLVGNASHILNRPVIDKEKGRVIEGYGVLQPRVSVGLAGAYKSLYSKINSLDSGIDPYTMLVSDTYQDVFGEGSFIGKGLYHIDAFEQLLEFLPENRILSHDLLEGCYTRSALVTDVELIEDYPSSYWTEASRRHRWVRGDWQIAEWLLPRVPSNEGTKENSVTPLSKWKIFDNLRRSITHLCMVIVLIAGWTNPSLHAAHIMNIAVLSTFLIPMLFSIFQEATHKQQDITWKIHFKVLSISVYWRIINLLLNLCLIPFEAHNNIDAVVRSLARMYFTKKNLLQWTISTADASSYASKGNQLQLMFERMWFAPTIGVVALSLYLITASFQCTTALACFFTFMNSLINLSLIGLWIASPYIAYFVSRPSMDNGLDYEIKQEPLNDSERSYLTHIARKTWRFFECFVREEDNWLPLDNYQEFPKPIYARRTSPTNIGFALLSNITAVDFGFITMGDAIDRIDKTVQTLDKMERYKGHFYNWYDTETLDPLFPRYISSVDSGNLVGYLLILKSSLSEYLDAPLLPNQLFSGLKENILVIEEELQKREKEILTKTDIDFSNVRRQINELKAEFDHKVEPHKILKWLEKLEYKANQLATSLEIVKSQELLSLSEDDVILDTDVLFGRESIVETNLLFYARAFFKLIESIKQEISEFYPWLHLLPLPDQFKFSEFKNTFANNLISRLHDFEDRIFSLKKLTTLYADMKVFVTPFKQSLQTEFTLSVHDKEVLIEWLGKFEDALKTSGKAALNRINLIDTLINKVQELANQDFTFLYDNSRDLLCIGYNYDAKKLDNSFYDTFCSEARLASYVCIANGMFPVKHWFSMSRFLTTIGGFSALTSWSGSMFEYLMPLLVMPTYAGTLLDQTYYCIVQRQIEYGTQKKTPWGISESAYAFYSNDLVYQYGPFGVPGTGLKRGLSDDLVIAPYAALLSLMVLPKDSCSNLKRLDQMGMNATYGFYESVDFTSHRLRGDIPYHIIRSFFAHHSGMAFLALGNCLLGNPMHERFMKTPVLQANELLLQERIPKLPHYSNPNIKETKRWEVAQYDPPSANRRYDGIAASAAPDVHLLSNGTLHVMMSIHGGGYINYGDVSISRWHEDVTLDGYGVMFYLRDTKTKQIWSTTNTPIVSENNGNNYSVLFSQAKAQFRRVENGIASSMTVCVSPYDNLEVRRVSLKNITNEVKGMEITSYGEVVLGKGRTDAAHRAFSNMFVQSEILYNENAILYVRKPRTHNESVLYAFHMFLMHSKQSAEGPVSFETDRYKFIGRGYSMQAPYALTYLDNLSNSDGFPLDPIFAIRQRCSIEPETEISMDFITGVANTREEALEMIAKYQKKKRTDFVIDYSWISSQKLNFKLNITEIDAQMFCKLASCLLYANPKFRATPALIAKNKKSQYHLWSLGLSGDRPIMVVRINDVQNVSLLNQCLLAHAYFRSKGLMIDLVIWNDETSSYRNELQNTVLALCASRPDTCQFLEKPGGIFPRRGEQLHEEEANLLYSVARVILTDNAGTLYDQLESKEYKPREDKIALLKPSQQVQTNTISISKKLEERNLILSNEFGGFDKLAREYVIKLNPGKATPHPWCNVIANEQFGCVISEKGSSYTWYDNAHEYRLTPFNNDAVMDGSGETYYLRDELSGDVWSPLPQPIKSNSPYICSHGMGYSCFDHAHSGIISHTTVFVPQDESVKICSIKLSNKSGRTRKLNVAGFIEWTLGELRTYSYPHIVTDLELGRHYCAVTAKNHYNIDYSNCVAFFSCITSAECTYTGSRTEFIGAKRTLANPAAMSRVELSNTTGASMDPCAALMTSITIEDGATTEIAFMLGASRTREGVKNILERIHNNLIVKQLFKNLKQYWNQLLDTIQVETPDPSVDVLCNGWILYQTLSSRIFGKSGFYQSSGAIGFRDQLQDTMAVVYSAPHLTRNQIIASCAHQFEKGDVNHWWHPNSGRGVRTTFSDDYLWLPLVTAHYVKVTGDVSILNESVQFLTGPEVPSGQESIYDQYPMSSEMGTVYEHCKRALRYGFKYGKHDLCLMGCGDWNDGMNLVGINGQGESVWLTLFLYHVLGQFEFVMKMQNDNEFLQECLKQKEWLNKAVETNAWDGAWYRRAYFDDGTPLGSSSNDECQIDSLPQSWGVISGMPLDETRVKTGLENAYKRLVRKDLQLIQLFDPPFEKTKLDPGYIKSYAPGIRENGGQYTHAAIWFAMAYALQKDTDRAWELFDIINPIHHCRTTKDLYNYRAEPYVIAADIYSLKHHEGQAGWSWYTGSAGWAYRLMVEYLLGIKREADSLVLKPVPKRNWKLYKVHYKFGTSTYHISFSRTESLSPGYTAMVTSSSQTDLASLANQSTPIQTRISAIYMDGIEVKSKERIPLTSDDRDHNVEVLLEDK